jgi:antitoxin component of MazEF toxin-antitoxin module
MVTGMYAIYQTTLLLLIQNKQIVLTIQNNKSFLNQFNQNRTIFDLSNKIQTNYANSKHTESFS